jgi:hypothetical protein
MVINMNAVNAGTCATCGHSYEAGFPVKLDMASKLTSCQKHPEYIVKVTEVETTAEERATLKSAAGYTVLVTAPKSKNNGNVIKLTERVFNPRYKSFFFVGYNVATGEKANLGEDTRCVVIFKTERTEEPNPHFQG